VDINLVGRAGLARVLGVSEATARALEARGEIAPETTVGRRALFSVQQAEALKAKRDAEQEARLRQRLDRGATAAA
jgi:DNA-binding transcriptional MerR regulator